MNIPNYDAWKLSSPDAEVIGTEEGNTCGRYHEPDEDMPRGFKPRPCQGVMHFAEVDGCTCHICPPCGACTTNPLICSECGEEA